MQLVAARARLVLGRFLADEGDTDGARAALMTSRDLARGAGSRVDEREAEVALDRLSSAASAT